jgi:protein involved in polysaccharide export with SLBB domain
MEGAGLQSDLDLNPGDIIVVPAYAPLVYVTGNVARPGVIQLSPDEELTAYSAILRCGGFARFAKTRGVYVLRDRGNGEKTRIPVDIKQVQSGKMSDVILQGKDIVVVPEKFFSF